MTTNPLPDLSKWHEVPADADIPIDVRYAFIDEDGDWATGPSIHSGRRAVCRDSTIRYFTAEPIPAPRPTPPTKPGTVLLDVTTTIGGRTWDSAHCIDDEEPRWRLIAGEESRWAFDYELVSWTVADVVPRKTDTAPDPLDENDPRDRRAVGKFTGRTAKLTRTGDGLWANSAVCATYTLQAWATAWDIRFADEAQS